MDGSNCKCSRNFDCFLVHLNDVRVFSMFQEFSLQKATPTNRFLGENEFKTFKIISENELLEELLTLLLGNYFSTPYLTLEGQFTKSFAWDDSSSSFRMIRRIQVQHISPVSLALYIEPFLTIAAIIRQFEQFLTR
jgi:hypothetical protein